MYTDPDKASRNKNPIPVGKGGKRMTFKEQLAKEAEERQAEEAKKLRWENFEKDLKRREERANEIQKEAQKVVQAEKMRKQREEIEAKKRAEQAEIEAQLKQSDQMSLMSK